MPTNHDHVYAQDLPAAGARQRRGLFQALSRTAFALLAFTATAERLRGHGNAYNPLSGFPADMSYYCLRLPAGGGKTWLAAMSVALVDTHLLQATAPLASTVADFSVPDRLLMDTVLRFDAGNPEGGVMLKRSASADRLRRMNRRKHNMPVSEIQEFAFEVSASFRGRWLNAFIDVYAYSNDTGRAGFVMASSASDAANGDRAAGAVFSHLYTTNLGGGARAFH